VGRGNFFADFGEVGGGGEAGEADGLETLNLVAEGTGEFAVNVEGAAAHAGDRTHFLDTLVGEFADDEGLAGAEGVAEDAGDFDGEGLGFGATKDGPDFTALAGFDVVEGEGGGVNGLDARGGLGVEKLKREGRGERGEQEQATERKTVAHEWERDGGAFPEDSIKVPRWLAT
jgi:hypothetical protein